MMQTRQIQYLRPDEILPELQQTPVTYIPFGLLEWHGPHLPLGVDSLNAEVVAIKTAEQTGGLVMPTVYFGTERERPPEVLTDLGFEGDEWVVGMDFPANSLPSSYAAEELFALVVRENFRAAATMGFKVIVAVSGHAATNQLETLKRIAALFNATGKVKVLVELPFVANKDGIMEVGHASRIETAVMLSIAPETVKIDNLPEAPEPLKNVDYAIVDFPTFLGQPTASRTVRDDDDPRRATAAEGMATIEKATLQIADHVKAALDDL